MGRRASSAKRLSLGASVIMAPGGEDGGGGETRPNALREFFVSHIKTIVTLFMIFGTIAVIVVIVMVHKVKLAEQHDEHERAHNIKWHGQELEREEACLDVAIVGAGLSGTYAAWRLRHSGLKVSLFEVSDRLGGRLHTRHLAGLGDVNAELGALYYLPQHHLLVNRTIRALGLSPRPLHRQSPGQPTYYLRGVHLQEAELTSDRLPYNLPAEEQHLPPDQLLRMYLSRAVSNESDLTLNPLRATTKDGRHLYKHGLWNLLGRVGSREGYSFLYDTAEWRSFLSNENAAVLGSVPMQPADRPMTVAEGMDEIPKRMAHQFMNASYNHDVLTNWRLSCIKKREFKPGYNLIFIKTITHGDATKDLYTRTEVCARRVVLALPPAAIRDLNWRPVHDKWQLKEDLDSVEPVPALRVLFTFDQKLASAHRKNAHRVTTDLPIRQTVYLGGRGPGRRHAPFRADHAPFHSNHAHHLHLHRKRRGKKVGPQDTVGGADEGGVAMDGGVVKDGGVAKDVGMAKYAARQAGEKHLYMVANVDSSDTRYFSDMLSKVKRETGCNRSDDIVKHVTRQLAQAYDIPESQVPTPSNVLVKDWAKTPGGCGWHIWKKGVKVDEVMNRMIKPIRRENVFVVGAAFCGGECQLWMEGALKTVDLLLQWYFNVR